MIQSEGNCHYCAAIRKGESSKVWLMEDDSVECMPRGIVTALLTEWRGVPPTSC